MQITRDEIDDLKAARLTISGNLAQRKVQLEIGVSEPELKTELTYPYCLGLLEGEIINLISKIEAREEKRREKIHEKALKRASTIEGIETVKPYRKEIRLFGDQSHLGLTDIVTFFETENNYYLCDHSEDGQYVASGTLRQQPRINSEEIRVKTALERIHEVNETPVRAWNNGLSGWLHTNGIDTFGKLKDAVGLGPESETVPSYVLDFINKTNNKLDSLEA